MVERNDIVYNKNIEELCKYRNIQNNQEILNYKPSLKVYYKDCSIVMKSENEVVKTLLNEYIHLDIFNIEAPLMFINEYFTDRIIQVQSRNLDFGFSIYLYYTSLKEFLEALQLIDILPILQKNNVIFLFGYSELKDFFSREQIKFPRKFLNPYINIVNEMKIDLIEILKVNIDRYYDSKDLKKVKEDFKVLICRDSTFGITYKDFKDVFEYNNIDYQFTSSKFDEYEFLNYIYDYKPTALLTMNLTQKNLQYYIHEKLLVITFLDEVSHLLTNKDYINNMGKYEILLLPCLDIEVLLPEEISSSKVYNTNVIKLPFVCNHNIFKTYSLNKSEKEEYGADICIVANFNNTTEELNKIFEHYNIYFIKDTAVYNNIKNVWNNMIKIVYEETKKRETIVSDICWFREHLIYQCKNNNLSFLCLLHEEFDIFVKTVFYPMVLIIYRSLISEWVLEKNYNVKLWGYGWDKSDKFKKFSMGSIEHGIKLSKVYNASKICLTTNPALDIHRRTFESILSNSFCLLSKSELGLSNIETIFERGKSIDFYFNKQELYDKIDYYLKNEDEREKIVKAGKKIILEKKLYNDETIKNAIEQAMIKVENIESDI